MNSLERQPDNTLEILSRRGEMIREKTMSVGDIKVSVSGTGFCDGLIKISLTVPEQEQPREAQENMLLVENVPEEAKEEFWKKIGSAYAALELGDEESAEIEREGALDSIINDDRLFGGRSRPNTALGDSREAILLNAAVLLYSERYTEVDEELDKVDITGNFDAIYLKARSYEAQKCWNEVKRLYGIMLRMYLTAEDERNSMRYWKFLFRLAILNEKQFNDPGIGIMRDLALMSKTEECFSCLRNMTWAHPELSEDAHENELEAMLFDKDVSDEVFLQNLRTVRAFDAENWNGFLATLCNMTLPYPW